MRVLRYLLIFVPVAVLFDYISDNATVSFFLAAVGLVALSGLLGDAIESLSEHTGPQISALLNATLGNAAELIITIVALRAGQIVLVKASITGAILGNLLVVPGLGMLIGGIKNGRQYFNRDAVGVHSTMMLLSVAGLLIPTLFEIMREIQRGETLQLNVSDPALDRLSLGFAGLLIVVYLLSLVFSLTTKNAKPEENEKAEIAKESATETKEESAWSVPVSIGLLIVSSLALIFLSDVLVGSVETMVKNFGWSEIFLGVILIPLVGDVAEHMAGVQQAYRNNMDLSLLISLGSGTQIALFVAPVLVFASWLMGSEMTLFFSPFEIVMLGLAVFIIGQITEDGESNWLEGVQLLVVYLLIAFGFFLF